MINIIVRSPLFLLEFSMWISKDYAGNHLQIFINIILYFESAHAFVQSTPLDQLMLL